MQGVGPAVPLWVLTSFQLHCLSCWVTTVVVGLYPRLLRGNPEKPASVKFQKSANEGAKQIPVSSTQ